MPKTRITTATLSKTIKAFKFRGKLQGLERLLQNQFQSQIGDEFKSYPIKSLGLKKRSHGTSGPRAKLDLFSKDTKIGLELKVVDLRESATVTPKKALYNVGQILSDSLDIKAASRVEVGYLLILFIGDKDFRNVPELARLAHNRLFLEFALSLHFGELKSEKTDLRRKQIKEAKKLKIDKPYTRTNSFLDIAVVRDAIGLGLTRVK